MVETNQEPKEYAEDGWGLLENASDGVAQLRLEGACLSVFHTLDHIAWLRKIKLIKGDGKATIRYNLRFLLAANALQAIYQASLYHRLFQAQSTCKDDTEENKQKVATIWRETLRSLMLCIQNLHNSELYETHDWISGLSGVITSAYDALKIWPTWVNMSSYLSNRLKLERILP